MLSAEINVSGKIKIEICFLYVKRKRKVTKFYKQIRDFSTNITLTIKSSEIAGKQTETSDYRIHHL